MAELFEEVVALLESRSATRALAGKYRIESEQSAGTGAVLGVPIFLAAMSDWAVDRDRSDSLSKVLRSIETTGLQDPGAAIDGRRHEPVGSELTNMLLGQRRPAVALLIAEEAGVKRSSANGLLPPTAWAVMASLADRYGSRIDRQSLIAILGREHQDLVDGGWGPWLEASGQSGSGPLVVDDSRSGFEPEEDMTLNLNLGGHSSAPAEVHNTGDWFSPAEEAFDPVDTYPPPVSRGARQPQEGLASAAIVEQQANGLADQETPGRSHPQHRLQPQHRDQTAPGLPASETPGTDSPGIGPLGTGPLGTDTGGINTGGITVPPTDAFNTGDHRLDAFNTGDHRLDAFNTGDHRLDAFNTGDHRAVGHGAADHGTIDRTASDRTASEHPASAHTVVDPGTRDHGTRDHRASDQKAGDKAAGDFGIGKFDSDRYGAGEYETEPFDDEDLVPNRVPLIIGTLVLFLLAVAGVYWLVSQQADSGDTTNDQPTETEGESDGESEDNADETGGDAEGSDDPDVSDDADGSPAEMVALDIVMDDPLGRSTATGVAELRLDDQKGEICYNFTVEELQSPFEGHIHIGPEGVKGGIVVDFGMLNNSDIGCTPVSANEVASILADLPGHYVELHDPAEAFTIRAQLSEALPEGAGSVGDLADGLYDPDGGGALARVESGRLVLVGDVADQATADRLLEEYDDVAELGLELVDELNVVAGAPMPSGLITVDNSALFAIGSDQLSANRGTVIVDLAALIQARPDWMVTIVGHTDSTGSEVINLALSLRRAEAVRDELIANGVATEKLLVTGAGSTKPVADNGTAEGRALNRRIELSIDRG